MCAVDLEMEDIKCETAFSQLDEQLINKEKDSSCFTCRWNPMLIREAASPGAVCCSSLKERVLLTVHLGRTWKCMHMETFSPHGRAPPWVLLFSNWHYRLECLEMMRWRDNKSIAFQHDLRTWRHVWRTLFDKRRKHSLIFKNSSGR